MKLLIIEDDADQRELIRETLEDHFGAGTVVAVGSGAEAMQQNLGEFNLILTDFNLPDTNGLDLLAKILQRCSTPVIMVTGENVGKIATEAIRRGATDYVVKFGDYLFTIPLVVEKSLAVANIKRENEGLRLQLEQTLQELRSKNIQLQESLQQVEQMAATDPLTQLNNRRHFGQVLEQNFAEAQRYGHDLSCVMIDLDGYKQLNDTFGHQVGDQLLVTVGKVIAANLRKADIAARYGGDEFVLLLPHADTAVAAAVAGRIGEQFAQASAALLRQVRGTSVAGVSMSIGVASFAGQRPGSGEQLVGAADKALYMAKDGGRARIVILPPSPGPTLARSA